MRRIRAFRIALLALVHAVSVSAQTAPPNDDCANAIDVSGLPFAATLDMSLAQWDGGTSCVSFTATAPMVWYQLPQLPGDVCVAPRDGAVAGIFTGTCDALGGLTCATPTIPQIVTPSEPLLVRLEAGKALASLEITAAVDGDGDGVIDCLDPCPAIPFETAGDRDGDGVGDACDNCPLAPNRDQADGNADGRGDACTPATTSYALQEVLHGVSKAAGDRFGYAVATFSDLGVLVGVPFSDVGGATDAGSAVVFGAQPPAVLQEPLPGPNDRFGTAVAVMGAQPVVGAPLDDIGATDTGAAFVFSNAPLQVVDSQHRPDAQLGFAVSAAAPGAPLQDTIVIGAPGDDVDGPGAGTALVVKIALTDPPAVASMMRLHSPTPAAGAQFGAAVAVLGDGTVAVGAPFDGTAGPPASGAVYLFNGTTGEFVRTVHAPAPAEGDLFGFAVAAVENDVLVGAPFADPGAILDAGAAYLIRGNQVLPLSNPSPVSEDHFGLAVGALGNAPLVAAPDADAEERATDSGAVYVFEATAGPAFGTVVQRFLDPTPTAADRFGFAVAGGLGPSSGDVLVGAPYDDHDGTDAGLVYRFRTCGADCQDGCGNGIVEASEECDDGNAVNGDGCDTNCTTSRCGNGVVGGTEECEPNLLPFFPPTCTADCFNIRCGGASVTAAVAQTAAIEPCVDFVDFCSCAQDENKCCTLADPCMENGRCKSGICKGTPKPCGDSTACTIDHCDPVTGECLHDPYDLACPPSESPCVVNTCVPDAGCVPQPITGCPCENENDGECDDQNPCNGTEACVPCVACRWHDSWCCSRGATCSENKASAPPDGTPCDDSSACTSDSNCKDGQCRGSDACTGADPCKTYFCIDDLAGCGCAFRSDCRPCTTAAECMDDGDAACGVVACKCPRDATACTQTFCVSTLPACNDDDECTLDRYDALACVAEPVVTVHCLNIRRREDPACAADTLPPMIDKRLQAAERLEKNAGDKKIRKKLRQLHKARNQLNKAMRKLIGRPGTVLSAGCRDALLAAVREAIEVIP
jgi:cysteine-rich repeat protein